MVTRTHPTSEQYLPAKRRFASVTLIPKGNEDARIRRFVIRFAHKNLVRFIHFGTSGGSAAKSAPAAATTPAESADQSSPLQLKIGDATITPVGFMDLTNTWRSTNVGTRLQTNFAAIPYGNTPQGRVIEDNFTAAMSRVGLCVDTKVKDVTFSATGESDFVGGISNAAFNTQVSSNSLIGFPSFYLLVWPNRIRIVSA